MKKKRALFFWIIGLFLISFLISFPFMPGFFMRVRGDRADLIYGAWYKADKSWSNGSYLSASDETLQALWMTTDFELRMRISRPFFRQAQIFEKQGELKKAINLCLTGANLLARYDMEGETVYYCDELDMKYHKTLPESATATPTLEP
jgi:hypothetical protein